MRFGACDSDCCETDCCIKTEELPTITIGGMTGSGWNDYPLTGETCCRRQLFTFDEEQPIYKGCGGTLRTWECETECTNEYIVKKNCNTHDSTVCCCPTYESLGTRTSIESTTGSSVLRVWYQADYIEVIIGKMMVDCGDGPVCKYFLMSRYGFKYRTQIGDGDSGSVRSLQFDNLTNECYEIPESGLGSGCFDDETTTTAACPGDYDPPIGGLTETTLFTKIKFYDTLPDTEQYIGFSGSDIAPGCTWNDTVANCLFEMSHDAVEYDQVCFSALTPTDPPECCDSGATFTIEDYSYGSTTYRCAELVEIDCDTGLGIYAAPKDYTCAGYTVHRVVGLAAGYGCPNIDDVPGGDLSVESFECVPQLKSPLPDACKYANELCPPFTPTFPMYNSGYLYRSVLSYSITASCSSWSPGSFCLDCPTWSLHWVPA